MKWMVVILVCLPLLGSGQYSVSLLNTKLKALNNAPHSINQDSKIPFEIIRGMMYVTASINNQEGNFIIDTGAALFIVNQTL